jgi:sodium transport system permease protein
MSLIPVTGAVLLLKGLLEGRYLEVLPYFLPVVAITGGCCLLAVRWAVDQFNSENVLFREGERGGLRLWVRHLLRDRDETPSVAEALLCSVLILTAYFFLTTSLSDSPEPFTYQRFAVLTVVTQLAVILTPTLLMTIICTRSPRQTLLLHRPKWTSIPAAAALAIALHPAVLVLGELLRRLYSVDPRVAELGKLLEGAPLWMLVLVMAAFPAVCEELAFRGFILSGLRHLGNRRHAVVIASIFFAMSHGLAVQQAINAGLLGLLLGYLATQTGNIFTGMAYHVTHNAAAIVLPTLAADWVQKHGEWSWMTIYEGTEFKGYHPLIVAAGIVVAGAILRRFAKLPAPLTYEEELSDAIRRRSEQATAA